MRRTALAIIAFAVGSTPAIANQFALWIPGWGSAQLNSIQTNAGSLAESNPVWYSVNADGTLAKKSNAENATWRAAMSGTRILPTIQNTTSGGFDGNRIGQLISTASSRDAHASIITQLAVLQAYDGVDIDYEEVPTAQRANFTAFLTVLGDKLHAAGKKLSVCVYAKTSDAEDWTGAGAQDWAAIGKVVDSVKIMAYDYHWSTSSAGAIAPLSWLDDVATYAESSIPASKIVMGFPFYGYDWSGSLGTDVGYADAMQTAAAQGATVTHDANGEATYTYSGRTVYFQDGVSYQKKLDLMKQKHPAIVNFTAWAAGQEDPAIWKIISAESLGSTIAPGDFAMGGPSTATVFHGASATAAFSLVPVNGFNGTANVSVDVPAGFTGSITPSATTVTANAPVTLTINPFETFPGKYAVTVRFTSGSLVHALKLDVSVVAAAPENGNTRRRAAGH